MLAAQSQPIRVHNQIDLAATLSCLLGVDVPESNSGVAFINDLANFSSADHSAVFECLNLNWQQLSRHTDRTSSSEFVDELVQKQKQHLRDADLVSLANLNIQIEALLRDEMRREQIDEKISSEQNLPMIISLACLLIVYKCGSI